MLLANVPFYLQKYLKANPPQGVIIYNGWLPCRYHLALRAQVPHLTWRSMVDSVCVLSVKTVAFLAYGATSCLSDHLAIRGLLRRELNHPGTPESSFFSKIWPYSFLCLSSYFKFTLLSLHVSCPLCQSILLFYIYLVLLPFTLIFLLSSYWDYPFTHSDSSEKALLKGTLTAVVRGENSVFHFHSQQAFPSQSQCLNQWPSSITSLAVHVHVIKSNSEKLWGAVLASVRFKFQPQGHSADTQCSRVLNTRKLVPNHFS